MNKGGNAACKAAGLLLNSLLMIVSWCVYVNSLNHPPWDPHLNPAFSCLCVHSSTSSMTALSLLIFLRGSWFCTLEGPPCTVKTVTWVNLAVSLRALRTLSRYYASTPGCSLTWSCQSGSSCFTFHSNLSQKHSPVLSYELLFCSLMARRMWLYVYVHFFL